MNRRERLLRTFQFKEVDRVPDYEFGYWVETIDRWHAEGLPLHLHNINEIEDYFMLEGWDTIDMLPINTGLWPQPPSRKIREYDDKEVIDDGLGGIYINKKWVSTIPQYLKYPIETKEDWEKIKPFFDPDTPGRIPLSYEDIVKEFRDRDYPLGIFIGSLYGWLRNLMGVKGISLAFYRDPDWLEEMMDTLVNLWIKLIRRALRSVKVDFATWWEDMAYNMGPLVSVKIFEEFMVPRYMKVTDVLKEYGVEINIVDCDGKIDELIPGWLKAGINGVLPIEARYTSPVRLREQYGNKILLMGGVNKLALIEGPRKIDEELGKLSQLVKEGGYIPMVDHRVPPDVSLSNYVYYLKAKRKTIGRNENLPYPEASLRKTVPQR
ncbi:MAG: uroporphyrinogen decarboxylase family protein [Thermoproteota archaeon]